MATDKTVKTARAIFTESAKSAKQIFAIFATFVSANFVGKESNESTVMYRVKSRITPITERKRIENGTETDRLWTDYCARNESEMIHDRNRISYPKGTIISG